MTETARAFLDVREFDYSEFWFRIISNCTKHKKWHKMLMLGRTDSTFRTVQKAIASLVDTCRMSGSHSLNEIRFCYNLQFITF